jgi:hypothetical protein
MAVVEGEAGCVAADGPHCAGRRGGKAEAAKNTTPGMSLHDGPGELLIGVLPHARDRIGPFQHRAVTRRSG